jgi:hypothetical protein
LLGVSLFRVFRLDFLLVKYTIEQTHVIIDIAIIPIFSRSVQLTSIKILKVKWTAEVNNNDEDTSDIFNNPHAPANSEKY